MRCSLPLVLLASMFFSGFVFPLQSIMIPARYIGFLLPVTYSIQNLQNVMLKRVPPAMPFLAALPARDDAFMRCTR